MQKPACFCEPSLEGRSTATPLPHFTPMCPCTMPESEPFVQHLNGRLVGLVTASSFPENRSFVFEELAPSPEPTLLLLFWLLLPLRGTGTLQPQACFVFCLCVRFWFFFFLGVLLSTVRQMTMYVFLSFTAFTVLGIRVVVRDSDSNTRI